MATVYLWVPVDLLWYKGPEYPLCTHEHCKPPWSAIVVPLKHFNYMAGESCVLLQLPYHPELFCFTVVLRHSEHGECLRAGSWTDINCLWKAEKQWCSVGKILTCYRVFPNKPGWSCHDISNFSLNIIKITWLKLLYICCNHNISSQSKIKI